ncbi:MAG: TraR/DksA family transcriptional regulator [Elusimicrobiota bacterium]
MSARKKAVSKKQPKAAGGSAVKKQPGTQFYEKRLLKMRADLMELVRRKQEKELPDQEVGDEADVATLSVERELLFELSDTERQNLDAIEAALRKIDQGRYGLCESCTKKIPKARLKVLPQARYCIACQSRFERPR